MCRGVLHEGDALFVGRDEDAANASGASATSTGTAAGSHSSSAQVEADVSVSGSRSSSRSSSGSSSTQWLPCHVLSIRRHRAPVRALAASRLATLVLQLDDECRVPSAQHESPYAVFRKVSLHSLIR